MVQNEKISKDNRLIFTLLIEDDHRLADLTAQYLRKHNLIVTIVNTGQNGLSEALKTPYDAILLDLMLPDMDGLEVCYKIRKQSDVPVIMLTARDEEADCVMGLEIGADDYIFKPFSSRELLARIRTAVRRYRGRYGRSADRTINIGNLSIKTSSMRAFLNGNEMDLTAYEFELLYVLAHHAGRVLSREQIMDQVKGNTEDSFDRSIDVHVSRIRQKLGDDPKRPRLIKTVRGAGYMFTKGESG